MIRDLDMTIKKMLEEEAPAGSELEYAGINFCIPDDKWRTTGSGLDLNIYLYDIRENRHLRSNDFNREYNLDGTINETKVSPRVNCAYIFTAWDKSSANNTGEEKTLQEHRLLSQVFKILLKNNTIKTSYLQSSLMGNEPDILVTTSLKEGLPNPVEFWNALGTPFRPAINCVFTFTMDLEDPGTTSPMVTTQINEYSLKEVPSSTEESIRIGGKVINTQNSEGISEAIITIPSLNIEVYTDKNGDYYINDIPSGQISISVSATGYNSRNINIEIPSLTGKYNLELTPS